MRRIPLLAALCAMLCAGSYADLTEEETLRGLDSIMLVVEELHEDAKYIGLTTEAIRNDVTGLLETMGIRLLTKQERAEDDRRPYLYVNCHILYVESIELTSFSIDVEVHQRVKLANGEYAQGLTWAKSYLGIQGRENAAQRIREILGAYLYAFLAEVKPQNAEELSDGPKN